MDNSKLSPGLISSVRTNDLKPRDFRKERNKSVFLPDVQFKFSNKKSRAGGVISTSNKDKSATIQSNKNVSSIAKPARLKSKKLSVASRLRDYSVLPKVSLQK